MRAAYPSERRVRVQAFLGVPQSTEHLNFL